LWGFNNHSPLKTILKLACDLSYFVQWKSAISSVVTITAQRSKMLKNVNFFMGISGRGKVIEGMEVFIKTQEIDV